MDGYQATAEIRRRENGSGRRTIVLALTGHAMEDERAKCLSAGMDGVITKPIRVEQLAAVLESCLRPKEPSALSATAT
jgi:two-component system, sensor histidine kinase and response regulator